MLSLFLSDLHLGNIHCNHEKLFKLLKAYKVDSEKCRQFALSNTWEKVTKTFINSLNRCKTLTHET